MEEWRRTRESNTYEVSNNGRVRNRRTGRMMKTFVDSHGYENVQLHYNGIARTHKIHRLEMDAFYDGDHIGLDVNHIDGNKRNNVIDNLEYCTRKENTRHAYRIGLSWSHKKKKVRIIETGEIFESITECAEHLGVSRHAISKCLSGNVQRCRGYRIEEI